MKRIISVLMGVVIMLGLFGCSKNNQTKKEEIKKIEEKIKISVTNETVDADIWIVPDTDENRKTSVWGTATVSKDNAPVGKTVITEISASTEKYLIRMIDKDEMYYSADGIKIGQGQLLIIRCGEEDMTAIIEVHDKDGKLTAEYEMFMARL